MSHGDPPSLSESLDSATVTSHAPHQHEAVQKIYPLAQRQAKRLELGLNLKQLGLAAYESYGRGTKHSKASRYLRLVCRMTSFARFGAGGSRFQPMESRWSRTYCLSKLG